MSGGLISFGFQHYTGKEFKSWQIMFLVVGLFTAASGILAFILLPDSPLSSRLSPREKYHAIERLRANQTGIENKTWKWYQFRESMSNFQATVIASFGFTNKEAALLNMRGGATNLTTCLIASYLATRYNQRFFSFIALILLGLTGGCLIAFLPAHQRGGKLFGMYLCNCTGAATPVTYSWISANYAGHTKKVTMSAILLICFSIGNIVGPLTFRTADEPDFIPAKVTIIVMCALAVTCASVLKFYHLWENRRRDRLGSDDSQAADLAFADLTDRENLKFRYRV
ncbi:MFS general substrate transporter [Fusarium sp. LHS14.1]|nr:MFS general substrate transporter [Fusarium sp. LHS14.1]